MGVVPAILHRGRTYVLNLAGIHIRLNVSTDNVSIKNGPKCEPVTCDTGAVL